MKALTIATCRGFFHKAAESDMDSLQLDMEQGESQTDK